MARLTEIHLQHLPHAQTLLVLEQAFDEYQHFLSLLKPCT
jgi:hypothetical protein